VKRQSDDNLTAIIAVFDYGDAGSDAFFQPMRKAEGEAEIEAERQAKLAAVKAEIQKQKMEIWAAGGGSQAGQSAPRAPLPAPPVHARVAAMLTCTPGWARSVKRGQW
jgi:hypothetical protein